MNVLRTLPVEVACAWARTASASVPGARVVAHERVGVGEGGQTVTDLLGRLRGIDTRI